MSSCKVRIKFKAWNIKDNTLVIKIATIVMPVFLLLFGDYLLKLV